MDRPVDEVQHAQRVALRVQARHRSAECDRVVSGTAAHRRRHLRVGAVDVEGVVAAAELDVDGFDRAAQHVGGDAGVEDHRALAVVDGAWVVGLVQRITGAEIGVVDRNERIAAHAHAGQADGRQLPGGAGRVARHIQRVGAGTAGKRDDATDAGHAAGRLADVQRVVASAAVDRQHDGGRDGVDRHRVVERRQLHADVDAAGGRVGDRPGHAEAGDRPGGGAGHQAAADRACHRAERRFRSDEDAVDRSAGPARAGVDNDAAQRVHLALHQRQWVGRLEVVGAVQEQRFVGVAAEEKAVGARAAL